MYRKLQTWWRQGIIEQNQTSGDIIIKQGTNAVIVTQDERDMFLQDIEAIPYLPAQHPSPGFGGTVSPIAPKKPKSMEELTQDLLYTAKGWRISTK